MGVGAEVGHVAMAVYSVSEDGLLNVITLAPLVRSDSLARCLGLPHSKLLGDEAVLYDLIDVLFLRKGAFVIKIQVAHLLADIWLMYTLGMVPSEALIDETLANEIPVDTGV